MATHRRGRSATQWPVADLLRREGRVWPSISPAVRGFVVGAALLCSTVVAMSLASEPAEHEPSPSPSPSPSPKPLPPQAAPGPVAPGATSRTPQAGGAPPRSSPQTSGVLAGDEAPVQVPQPAPAPRTNRRPALPDLPDGHSDNAAANGSRIVAGTLDHGRPSSADAGSADSSSHDRKDDDRTGDARGGHRVAHAARTHHGGKSITGDGSCGSEPHHHKSSASSHHRSGQHRSHRDGDHGDRSGHHTSGHHTSGHGRPDRDASADTADDSDQHQAERSAGKDADHGADQHDDSGRDHDATDKSSHRAEHDGDGGRHRRE